MNRRDRRAERARTRSTAPDGTGPVPGTEADEAILLQISDRFIDLANRENVDVPAHQVHIAFLYAAARYNAFVAKSVMGIDQHEPFVEKMVAEYRDMLRQHLADASLERPTDE